MGCRNIDLDAATAVRPGAGHLSAAYNIGLSGTAGMDPEICVAPEYIRQDKIPFVIIFNIQPEVEMRIN